MLLETHLPQVGHTSVAMGQVLQGWFEKSLSGDTFAFLAGGRSSFPVQQDYAACTAHNLQDT